jgi:hypothetical protein
MRDAGQDGFIIGSGASLRKNKLKPTSLVGRRFNASLQNFHHVADDAILRNHTITKYSFSIPTNEKFQYIPTRQPRTD